MNQGGLVKTCSKCKISKPASDFYKAQGYCKECQKEYKRSDKYKAQQREYFQTNISARANRSKRKRTRVENNLAWLKNYLEDSECTDCGNIDIRVLEFDHVRGEKHRSVVDLASSGAALETIVKEIEKCEVRCSNCHKIITMKRLGKEWWRSATNSRYATSNSG